MFQCVLTIKVCNAANRDQDGHYRKSVELALPPLPGTVIVVGDHKIGSKVKTKEFTVRTYKQHEVNDPRGGIIVTLDPDNTTFKQPGEFGRICKRLEELGFYQEPSDAPTKRRARSTTSPSAESP